MEFTPLGGLHAGKSHAGWQWALREAQEHLMIAKDGECRMLVVGFIPGRPELTITITFKLNPPEPPRQEPTLRYIDYAT